MKKVKITAGVVEGCEAFPLIGLGIVVAATVAFVGYAIHLFA
jgi:hypothetical protein